jgi:hypothetical protein
MNRKPRARRSKIPMSVRNGESGLVLLGGVDGERRSQPPAKSQPPPNETATALPESSTAQAELSPPLAGPRPQAPPLTFPSTPPRPAAESVAHAFDKPPLSVGADDGAAPEVHPDEVSVPPVGLDSDFFGGDPAFAADASLEIDARDPRMLKLTPLMAQRRARLARYVAVAVGFAAILGGAAIVKITLARGADSTARGAASRNAVTAASPGPAQEPVAAPAENTAIAQAKAPQPESVPAATAPPAEPVAAAAPATPEPAQPAAAAAQAESAPAPGAAAAAPAEAQGTLPPEMADLDPKALAKEAGKAKAKARGALEWGKMGDAIEAGERSVAIDPTDSEAWLILGAAYQQKGDAKNAVRSFKACLDQGKRGPRNECAAMMRMR